MAQKSVEILYEDDYLIAINKEHGILTIPDRFDPLRPNLLKDLKDKYTDIIPVHRLDKNTSGIVLFAKSPETHSLLSQQFEAREIQKYYSALVDGHPTPESGLIDIPIAESTTQRGKMIAHKRGKASSTKYKIVNKWGSFSELYLQILTGRMHQIRVHLQYLGHPLIVDDLYGRRNAFYVSEIKKKYNTSKYTEEKPILTRSPLHATRIVFFHPHNQNEIDISCPMPKDMQATKSQLVKWCSSRA